MKPSRILLTTIASLAVAASGHAAAVDVWNATTGSWDTSSTNWLVNSLPGTFANGDSVEFSAATGDSAITLGATVNPTSILSNGANTPATMTINGTAGAILELGASGAAGTGAVSDAAGLSTGYAGNLTYNAVGASGATVFSLLAGSGTAAAPTVWNIASGKTFQISAATAGEIADLNGNTLNLTGAGTVNFANGITLQSSGSTGTINVNAGTLSFTGGGSRNTTISSSITVNVAPGATLNLAPNSGGGSAFNQVTNLNGGTLSSAGGGTTTDAGALTVASGASTISAAGLTGTTFSLTGTYSRSLGATVNFSTNSTTIATAISTTNALLSDSSTGAAYATYNNTDFAAVDATGKIIPLTTLGYGNTLSATGNFSTAGTVNITGASTTQTLVSNSSSPAVLVTGTGNTIALGGFNLVVGGILGTQNYTVSGTGTLQSQNMGGELVLNQSANTGTINSVIADNLTPSILVKAGAGTVVLGGANTYSGGTIVNAGTLQASVPTTAGTESAFGTNVVIVNSGATVETSTGSTSNALTWNNGFTLNNATLISQDGVQTFTGAFAISGNNTLNAYYSGKNLVVSGVIQNGTSPGSLIIAGQNSGGTSTTVLSNGGNTYTGTTTVQSGNLQFAHGALGSTSAIVMNGGNLQWGAGNTDDISSKVTLVNGKTATFDTNGNAVTFATPIGGGTSAAVTFKGGTSGTAKFTLNAANTYTGGATVTTTGDNTAVAVGNALAFGTGPVTIAGNTGSNQYGTAILVNTGINVANALTLTPGSSATTRATLGLSSNSTWSGNITVNGASGNSLAVITSGASTAATACIVAGNINHTGSNANNLTLRGGSVFGNVTGNISYGAGEVDLLDNTNWQFIGASNTWGTLGINNASATAYVGAANTLSPSGVITTSTAGATLKLNNFAGTASFDQTIGGLGNTSGVSVKVSATQAATLTINNSSSQSSSGAISGSISLVEAGTATQTLTGTSAYTGATTVRSGTLMVSGTLSGTTSVAVTGGMFQLGASNAVKTSTPITLGGGTFNSAGFNQTFGTLNLSASSSNIDFGVANASSVLLLADSTGVAWGTAVTLSITDWNGNVAGGGADQLLFTNTGGGLTAGQLADITFVNPAGFAAGFYGAQAVVNGSNIEIVPIPEPSALAALLGGAGMLGLVRRRRK